MDTIDVYSPRGRPVRMAYRPDTSDLSTIGSHLQLWGNLVDEYRLAGRTLTGTVVDAGCHVGSVAVAILADNPEARVLCIEPLPDNCAVIRESLALNGLSDRAVVLEGAVGKDARTRTPIYWDFSGSETALTHRYIGNLSGQEPHRRIMARTYSLAGLVREYGPIAAIKLDCEGGEWGFLDSAAVHDVPLLFGEAHGSDWQRRLHELLPYHALAFDRIAGVVGNFEAVR